VLACGFETATDRPGVRVDRHPGRRGHPEKRAAQLPGLHHPPPLTPRTPSLTQRALGAERADVSDDNRGILAAGLVRDPGSLGMPASGPGLTAL